MVAYCAAVSVCIDGVGRVDWATQLVVAEPYREERVATQLLHSLWGFSDSYAWGLATANPFAVRALEAATHRPCSVKAIRKFGPQVLAALSPVVKYLPDSLVESDGTTLPIVDTKFQISHDHVAAMRKAAARSTRPWALGGIDEGQEWFACTFRTQRPTALTSEELDRLLRGADQIWLDAYARMALDDKHAWHRHGEHETACIESLFTQGTRSVLDVGCGNGRHTQLLADRGFEVVARDIVPELVDAARVRLGDHADIEVADARKRLGVPNSSMDAAIMLYDVLGSSATPADDDAILRNVAAALRPGGTLVLTVMNAECTLGRLADARKPVDDEAFVRALEGLEPSKTMEQTGDVFDPRFLLYYKGVFYRKEQFEDATTKLPVEYIVRDRRFTREELTAVVQRAGLAVKVVRSVRAGDWNAETSATMAKEILVVATKPPGAFPSA